MNSNDFLSVPLSNALSVWRPPQSEKLSEPNHHQRTFQSEQKQPMSDRYLHKDTFSVPRSNSDMKQFRSSNHEAHEVHTILD